MGQGDSVGSGNKEEISPPASLTGNNRYRSSNWFTSKQAAEYLGMSRNTFLRRVKAFPELLPYENPTHIFRFKRSDIEAFSQVTKTRQSV